MPGLAFKILAVSDIADNGIAVRFGERGSMKDYIYVHDTGVKCKLGKFKGVYVLKTVDVSQVAAAHKVETKRVIEPKLHVDTDLWYYFGRKSPPNTGGIVVKDDGISQYCGRSPMPAIAGVEVAHKKVPKSEAQIEFDMSKNPLVFDYCGKMRVRSHGGASGFFCATTKQQRYTQVFPVKEKTVAANANGIPTGSFYVPCFLVSVLPVVF